MRNFLIAIVCFAFVAIISANTQVNDDCEELKKENESLKLKLEEAKKRVEVANFEAQRQATLAVENAKRAQEQAEASRQAMRNQAAIAAANAAEAERQRKLAEDCAKSKN